LSAFREGFAASRNGTAGHARELPADRYPVHERMDCDDSPPAPDYPGDHALDQADASTLDEVDAAELATSEETYHLDYLPLLAQHGYMVRGWSHLIAGYPRTGKTELVTACCRDWLQLGESVLYLTEEPRLIWQARLSRAPDAWGGMRLVFGLGTEPSALWARARTGKENIIVVDAIRNLGLVGPDENDNTALARSLTPWVRMARDGGKTLILMHHDRKGGGDHGQAIAGGHALLGIVDIALELLPDTSPSRRLIRARARIIQPAEMMYERREDGTLRALGDPGAVGVAEVRRRVLDVVEGEWLKTAEVRDRLDEPRPSLPMVREALGAEAKAGTIERDPPLSEATATGKTHRWRAMVRLENSRPGTNGG
jgi:predicted ATP-dependent serine protease